MYFCLRKIEVEKKNRNKKETTNRNKKETTNRKGEEVKKVLRWKGWNFLGWEPVPRRK